MTTSRDHATGCIYCGHPTWELDKVCNGPSCRRLHGHPIYLPDPTADASPLRRVVIVGR